MAHVTVMIKEATIAAIREEIPYLSAYSAEHVWAATTVLAKSELARVFAAAAAGTSWVFVRMIRTEDESAGVTIGGANWTFQAEAAGFAVRSHGTSEAFLQVHQGVVPDIIELGAMPTGIGAEAAAQELLARVGVLCVDTVVGHC